MGWVVGIACVTGAALALPEWLPGSWTREDGVVEWAGFACYLVAGILVLLLARRLPRQRRAVGVAVAGLVLLAIAGEEISWGQRIFDLGTPAPLVDGNRQDELNLHNVDGLQQKAVLGQLALAVAGSWLWLFRRSPWARAGVPCFLGYLAYRATRGVAALFDWAPAGDNAEAAELLLAAGVVLVAIRLTAIRARPRVPAPSGLRTAPVT